MGRYILIRSFEAIVAIWGVLLIVFLASRLGGGDPAVLLLPMGASDADLDLIRHNLGLDRPLWDQYFTFMANALRGDFGFSFEHNRPAMQVILERLPATMQLATFGILIGTLIGLSAGMIAALRRGTLTEFAVMLVALIGQAMPVFWLGLVLMMVFAVHLQWLPSGGTQGLGIILPGFTLAVYISASLARLLRSSMVEILHEDYIRTARAKGLDPSRIYIVHAVRSALIPVVTMLGIIIGETLSGTVIIETIFSWPGVGRVTVQAIAARDFAVVQAAVTVFAFIFVVVNLAVDLLYAVLDPRVRLIK